MPNIQVKLRRGTTAQHAGFTGAEGEVTVDTDKDTVIVHDGTTAGGHELLKGDNDFMQVASDKVRIGGSLGDANLESISQVGITSNTQSVLTIESTDTDASNDNAVVVIQAPGYATLGLYDTNESLADGSGWYNINSVDGKFSIGSLAVGGSAVELDLIEFARKTISSTDYMVPNFPALPTAADNTAAVAAGLATDDVYKTSTGELRIVV
jgi:hypothetical protein